MRQPAIWISNNHLKYFSKGVTYTVDSGKVHFNKKEFLFRELMSFIRQKRLQKWTKKALRPYTKALKALRMYRKGGYFRTK